MNIVVGHMWQLHERVASFSGAINSCCRCRFRGTQNLSSILSDPHKSRHQNSIFFTRDHGDYFVPKSSIAASPLVCPITKRDLRSYRHAVAKVRFDWSFLSPRRFSEYMKKVPEIDLLMPLFSKFLAVGWE